MSISSCLFIGGLIGGWRWELRGARILLMRRYLKRWLQHPTTLGPGSTLLLRWFDMYLGHTSEPNTCRQTTVWLPVLCVVCASTESGQEEEPAEVVAPVWPLLNLASPARSRPRVAPPHAHAPAVQPYPCLRVRWFSETQRQCPAAKCSQASESLPSKHVHEPRWQRLEPEHAQEHRTGHLRCQAQEQDVTDGNTRPS